MVKSHVAPFMTFGALLNAKELRERKDEHFAKSDKKNADNQYSSPNIDQ
jgi:hypothetical protein